MPSTITGSVETIQDLPAQAVAGETYAVKSEGYYYSYESGWVRADAIEESEVELPIAPLPGEARPPHYHRPEHPIELPEVPDQLPDFGPEGPTEEDIEAVVPPIELPPEQEGVPAPPIADVEGLKKRAALVLGLLRRRRDSVVAGDAAQVLEDAYYYLYPLILMDVTRRVLTQRVPRFIRRRTFGLAPANEFAHAEAYPAADDRAVVRPNFDTLYSSMWWDLSRGPVEISKLNPRGRSHWRQAKELISSNVSMTLTRH
jgi:hypothetical protein